MEQQLVLPTLVYLLCCWCAVCPPGELRAAGFTLPQLLGALLGSEDVEFCQYHRRRFTATLVVHSCLPLGYIICLLLNGWLPSGTYWEYFFIMGFASAPLLVLLRVLDWRKYDWTHPFVKNLLPYCNDGNGWQQVASSINSEFRSVDKVSIQINAISKVVVTSTWIVKISLYKIHFAKQSDATLIATNTDTHQLSISGEPDTQYVNIEVKPNLAPLKSFFIRLNVLDFKDLQDRVSRPIIILPSVNFQSTILEKFIHVFKQHVEKNPPYYTELELEICIGCMQAPSSVKLLKQCEEELAADRACTECHCRPMWCTECMGRWWASRQEADAWGAWLGARCSCPVCRATFCMLDVCPVRAGEAA